MLPLLLTIALSGALPADSADIAPRHLEEGWRIRAGDDPAWASPGYDHSAWTRIEVPEVWETVLPDYDGVAWYRLEVELPEILETGPLGLRFGSVGDAFEVYWNGVEVGENGRLPPAYVEGVEPVLFLVPAEALARRQGDRHLLAVRVYNGYAWGGLMGGAVIGRYDRLAQQPTRGEVVLGGLVAFFLAIGIYHLAFFIRRRDARENLYFFLLCSLAAIFTATMSVAFLSRIVHLASPFRIDLIVLVLGAPVFIGLVRHLFDLPEKRSYAMVSIAAVAAIPLLAIAPLSVLSSIYVPLEALLMTVLIGVTVTAWRYGSRHKRPGGFIPLLAGLGIFCGALAWDVLSEIGWVPVARLVPGVPGVYWLGFLALIVGVGIATASKFAVAEVRARKDMLTSLARRHVFDETVERECERLNRSGNGVAVAIIDLDHFKLVNDAHGHRAGDAILREIGRVLKMSSRNIDVLARIGGEEFGVVLCDTDLDGALVFADRFRRNLSRLVIVHEGRSLRVTASMGIAATEAPMQPEALIEAADRNLYAAKESGRNRIVASRAAEAAPPRAALPAVD